MTKNKITTLLGIRYPIVQGGMIWCSGWELAAAVSNAGGLGLIGSGSMYPEVLRLQIQRCKAATKLPFGVNLPLMYPDIDKHIQIIVDEKVPVVFTSAGSPSKYTAFFKSKGIKVVHVVSSAKFALKSQQAGVDAIVAEGFEAGGHNGIEETTTFCLLPQVKQAVTIPIIAAGGIASGAGMLAAFALGADGIQMGSRFVASLESSAHASFKSAIINANEGDTRLALKKIGPVRLLRNAFAIEVDEAEKRGATADELKVLLGKARAKKGMFEGDLQDGELEIGQVAATINKIQSASDIINEIINDFKQAQTTLCAQDIDK